MVSKQEHKRASYWSSCGEDLRVIKWLRRADFIIIITIVAIFTPWIAPYGYDETDYAHTFEKPAVYMGN